MKTDAQTVDKFEESEFVYSLFSLKMFQLISEIRSLSADCLPSFLHASVASYSAGVSQISSIEGHKTEKNIKDHLIFL
ncbi:MULTISPECIES: hypothetical protein [unclassified Bacillus (in: firmicutes)]|uniref:hypothetical protein n=1 Tax=unclassified Bacillus (in: firmicutes) TaxID=185979 RepID=UPI001BED2B01|nr:MULTISPECIES: hypothetical protein [unclassified Bacillus (in: firmicutes)]MBT2618402.1 hypothetical protein [Bacillus sp. ISL-78]MBT2629924.1 hypothetical protein [Bacillus sp. ISL-101]MBT2716677.1 hypothetical protein [Bacillus sp. ISL-57]